MHSSDFTRRKDFFEHRQCWSLRRLVLATVPGYPAVVRVLTRTGRSSSGYYPERMGTHQVRRRVRTRPRFHFLVATTLAPIKYLNCQCIARSSIREMCWLIPCFISHSQISDRSNIHWVALKLRQISRWNDTVFIATQQLLVQLQIGEWEMKEGIKLHISCIDYVTIRSELQYLIGARNVDFWGMGFVWKPVATVRNQTRNLDPLLTLAKAKVVDLLATQSHQLRKQKIHKIRAAKEALVYGAEKVSSTKCRQF